MKIHKFFGKKPELLNQIVFKTFKQKINAIISPLIKETTLEKPAPFLLNGSFDFSDKKQDLPLIIFGKPSKEFKDFGKLTCKEELGVLGLAHFGGQNTDEQTKLHFNIAKGTGKTKLKQLEKNLYKLFPKTTYELILGAMEEDDFDQLETNSEKEEEDDIDEGEAVEDEKIKFSDDQITKLLVGNLKKISFLYKPIKSATDISLIQEDVAELLEYIDDWQELLAQNEEQAKTLGLLAYKSDIQKIEDMLRNFGTDQELWDTWKSVTHLKGANIRNNKKFIESLCALEKETHLQDHVFKGEYTPKVDKLGKTTSIEPKGLHHHATFKAAPPNDSVTYNDGDVMMLEPHKRTPNPPVNDKPYGGYFSMFSQDAQNTALLLKSNKKAVVDKSKKTNDFGWASKKSTFFPTNWDEQRVLEECAYAFSLLQIKPMPDKISENVKYLQRINSPSKTCEGPSTCGFNIEFLIPKTLTDKTNETNTGVESLLGTEKMSDVKTFYPVK